MTNERSRDAVETYLAAAFDGMAPVTVVCRLYERALRHLDDAGTPTSPGFVESLCRAREVVTELRLALDRDVAGAPTAELASLYLFCETRLGDALGARDARPLDDVRRVLGSLLSAWRAIEQREAA